MRCRGLSDAANWPVRGDPLARGMGQHGGEIDGPGNLVNGSRLHRGNLVLAKNFSHDVETTRQRCVAKGLLAPARPLDADSGNQRLLRIDQLDLRFGEGRRQRRN